MYLCIYIFIYLSILKFYCFYYLSSLKHEQLSPGFQDIHTLSCFHPALVGCILHILSNIQMNLWLCHFPAPTFQHKLSVRPQVHLKVCYLPSCSEFLSLPTVLSPSETLALPWLDMLYCLQNQSPHLHVLFSTLAWVFLLYHYLFFCFPQLWQSQVGQKVGRTQLAKICRDGFESTCVLLGKVIGKPM